MPVSANGTDAGPSGSTDVPTGPQRRAIWVPEPAELSDVELLLDGAFPPLRGFLSAADVESVRTRQQLGDGVPWP